MVRLHCIFPLFLLFLGCSSSADIEIPEQYADLENLTIFPPGAESASSISLEPDAEYGDTGEVILGRMAGTAVDEAGRVFIADGDKNIIHVYDADGTYLQHVGSQGAGPGEFENIAMPQTGLEYLYALDWSQRRLNAFRLDDLSFSHTIDLMREDHDIEELNGVYPSQYELLPDGQFLVSYNEPFRAGDDLEGERFTLYYKLDEEGKAVNGRIHRTRMGEYLTDQIGQGFMVMGNPFGRSPLISLLNTGGFVSGWTEDFLIKFHKSDGTYERAVYHPFVKATLDRDAVINEYEEDRQRRMVRNAEAPASWPALNSMITDDENRLWISTIVEDGDVYEWWVLNEEGEKLDTFTWPRSQSIQQIKNGYLYARQEDEMGLVQIVKYRIEFL